VLVTFCFLRQFFEGKIKREGQTPKEEEEEDLRIYWITFRRGGDTHI
jgi:hypothetical protein